MTGSTIRKVAIVTLATVCVVSGGFAAKVALERDAEEATAKAIQTQFVTVVEPSVPSTTIPTETTPTFHMPSQEVSESESSQVVPEVEENPLQHPGISIDFAGLLAANSDVCGWLYLPGTGISYPLLQGESNQQYLRTAYDKTYSYGGSLFLDYRVPGDFSGVNTIIYGHNMKSNTMFSQLKHYEDPAFVAGHPNFYILTPSGYLQYEIVFVVPTVADASFYDLPWAEEEVADQIAQLSQLSLMPAGITMADHEKLVMLSTCADVGEENRLLVVGRLVGSELTP